MRYLGIEVDDALSTAEQIESGLPGQSRVRVGFDIALSAVFDAGRFDLGWYAGRIYGLLATSFVLAMLLLENSRLYSRLVDAHESDREKVAELHHLAR